MTKDALSFYLLYSFPVFFVCVNLKFEVYLKSFVRETVNFVTLLNHITFYGDETFHFYYMKPGQLIGGL